MRPPHPTLLISDDDSLLLAALTRQARCCGLAVIGDGTCQARTLAKLRPDIILLDLNQPVNGRELLVGLKADPGTSAIPVIVMTGGADGDTREQCLRLGAADFVEKPFDRMFMARLARLAEEVSDGSHRTSSPSAGSLRLAPRR